MNSSYNEQQCNVFHSANNYPQSLASNNSTDCSSNITPVNYTLPIQQYQYHQPVAMNINDNNFNINNNCNQQQLNSINALYDSRYNTTNNLYNDHPTPTTIRPSLQCVLPNCSNCGIPPNIIYSGNNNNNNNNYTNYNNSNVNDNNSIIHPCCDHDIYSDQQHQPQQNQLYNPFNNTTPNNTHINSVNSSASNSILDGSCSCESSSSHHHNTQSQPHQFHPEQSHLSDIDIRLSCVQFMNDINNNNNINMGNNNNDIANNTINRLQNLNNLMMVTNDGERDKEIAQSNEYKLVPSIPPAQNIISSIPIPEIPPQIQFDTNKLELLDTIKTKENTENKINNKNIVKKDNKLKRFLCSVCSKSYKNLCNLKSHFKIHTAEAIECSYCKKKFGRKANYKEHLRIHTGETPYICKYCSRRFKHHHSWKDHLRIHTGEKPYECSVCFKKFKVGHNLTVHYRIHTGEKPHRCDICLKSFRQKSALNSHRNRIHLKKK